MGDEHTGDAEGAEQLDPNFDDACLVRHSLVGTKLYQGLPTDQCKDARYRRALHERPGLHVPAIDTPGTDAEEQENPEEKRRGDEEEGTHAPIVAHPISARVEGLWLKVPAVRETDERVVTRGHTLRTAAGQHDGMHAAKIICPILRPKQKPESGKPKDPTNAAGSRIHAMRYDPGTP